MFNFNAVVKAFSLVNVNVGAYQDKEGFVLVYRPSFSELLDFNYGVLVAPTSFVDAEDLFHSLVSYYEINLVPTVVKSMVDFVARLEKVAYDYEDKPVQQILDFVTIYEDRYSSNTYDEVRFYAGIRQDLEEEMFRLGTEKTCLAALYNVADQALHYRKDYNS